ncbi:MAG: aa3-type cytochrome c oxidase subunit IV [Sphingomonas sp.]|nr:MAG: aa3-type cytochrome c oxidase subunit IV [Sphingomonas sp.]
MAEVNNGAEGGTSWETADADNRTVYSGFLGLTKWAIILITIVLILMAIFLT